MAALVSPWHVWHPVGDIGLPARYARECGPCLVAAPLSSWQLKQVAVPA